MPPTHHSDSSFPDHSDCIGLILAAGAGLRFRESHPPAAVPQHKLLQPLADGRPVALASAQALLTVIPHVLAIVAPEPTELHELLRKAGCIVTIATRADEGMGASLAQAADLLANDPALPAWRRLLIALADMPWIRPHTLQQLVRCSTSAPIVAPRFQGRRGHPVRLDARLLGELSACKGDEGARHLLTRHPVQLIDVDDPGVLADIDVWQDLYPDLVKP